MNNKASDLEQSVSGAAPRTVAEAIQMRAARSPDKVACVFLEGGTDPRELTYRELDRRARAVAVALADAGATGERALLLFRPGLDYIVAFIGCLYAKVVAVPAYPPDLARLHSSLARLQGIARNARPALALTTSDIRGVAAGLFKDAGELAALPWRAVDTVDDDMADRYAAPEPEPDLPAFLQYTSGSTGDPKGVILTHANLLANLAMIERTFRMHADDRVVSWLPPYHDMGLIGTILEPLYVGGQAILLSPLSFLRRPRRWLEAVSRYRGTVMGGPNFAYGLCVRKISEADREDLDLSSLEVAFCGAEPIRSDTMEAFATAFAPQGFRRSAFLPCYGLAEATLLVSGASPDPGAPRGGGVRAADFDAAAYERGDVVAADADPPGPGAGVRTLVGAGAPTSQLTVRIVDPDTGRLAAPGRIGEIWVSGASVSPGYWGQTELSQATFGGRLHGDDRTYLRTGDLGFVGGGELHVCGRLKDLIIVGGRNIHPQDVELAVEASHELVRPGSCAAFSIERGGREQAVVVVELVRQVGIDVASVAGAIRRGVATAHGLRLDDVVLVKRGSVPKTTSGKLRRRACRAEYLTGRLDIADTSAPARSAA